MAYDFRECLMNRANIILGHAELGNVLPCFLLKKEFFRQRKLFHQECVILEELSKITRVIIRTEFNISSYILIATL